MNSTLSDGENESRAGKQSLGSGKSLGISWDRLVAREKDSNFSPSTLKHCYLQCFLKCVIGNSNGLIGTPNGFIGIPVGFIGIPNGFIGIPNGFIGIPNDR